MTSTRDKGSYPSEPWQASSCPVQWEMGFSDYHCFSFYCNIRTEQITPAEILPCTLPSKALPRKKCHKNNTGKETLNQKFKGKFLPKLGYFSYVTFPVIRTNLPFRFSVSSMLKVKHLLKLKVKLVQMSHIKGELIVITPSPPICVGVCISKLSRKCTKKSKVTTFQRTGLLLFLYEHAGLNSWPRRKGQWIVMAEPVWYSDYSLGLWEYQVQLARWLWASPSFSV